MKEKIARDFVELNYDLIPKNCRECMVKELKNTFILDCNGRYAGGSYSTTSLCSLMGCDDYDVHAIENYRDKLMKDWSWYCQSRSDEFNHKIEEKKIEEKKIEESRAVKHNENKSKGFFQRVISKLFKK